MRQALGDARQSITLTNRNNTRQHTSQNKTQCFSASINSRRTLLRFLHPPLSRRTRVPWHHLHRNHRKEMFHLITCRNKRKSQGHYRGNEGCCCLAIRCQSAPHGLPRPHKPQHRYTQYTCMYNSIVSGEVIAREEVVTFRFSIYIDCDEEVPRL